MLFRWGYALSHQLKWGEDAFFSQFQGGGAHSSHYLTECIDTYNLNNTNRLHQIELEPITWS